MTSIAEAAAPSMEAAGSSSPFRGLVPFTERDSDYFFGRAAEREIIAANLIASRLTLLYAPSGVGKSSVLLAGVVHDLGVLAADEISAGRRPEYVPVVVRRWRDDPLGALRGDVREGLRRVYGEDVAAGHPDESTLAGELDVLAHRANSTLLVILDQFEEFLLYHGDRWEPGDPAPELARLLSAPDLDVNVLIALREDALAGLDRFKGRVPHLFENYLRLKHLDAPAARQAIEKPVAEWNRTRPDSVEIEADFVDAVLEQLGSGRVALSHGGGRGTAAAGAQPGIEAPFLQLVLTRVWEEERAAGSAALRKKTLDKLGGAGRIVGTYLDDQMGRLSEAEQRVASAAFRQLVTPSGTKIAHSLRDLADYTGVPAGDLQAVLEKLSAGDAWRILRCEAGDDDQLTYEIFHDVLAGAVLDWRGRFEKHLAASEAVAEERAAGRRRRRRVAIVALALGGVAAALLAALLFALAARRDALDARDDARSSRLLGAARSLMADDPELAVLLIRRAGVDDRVATTTLRAALNQLPARRVLPSRGGGVRDVVQSPDGSRIAAGYEDGDLRFWNLATGRMTGDVPAGGGAVTGLDWSADGNRIVSTTREGHVTTWRAADGRRLHSLERVVGEASAPQWSADGTRVLAVAGTGASVWDARSGELLRTFVAPTGPVTAVHWARSRDRIVIAAANLLQLRAVGDGRVIRQRVLKGEPDVTAVSADDRRMVSIYQRRTALGTTVTMDIWDLRRPGEGDDSAGGAITRHLSSFVNDVQFMPKGGGVALALADGRVAIYDSRNGTLTNVLSGAHTIDAVRPLPGGGTVVTASADGVVRTLDSRTGEQLSVFPGLRDLTAMTVIRTGALRGTVVSADADGAIHLWEPTPNPTSVLPSRRTTSMAEFTRDGQAVIGASDGGLRLWRSWRTQPTLREIRADAPVVRSEMSPNGSSVAGALASGRVQIWDVQSGRPIPPLPEKPGGSGWPVDVAFSPDGRYLAGSYDDGTIVLWSADDHATVARQRPTDTSIRGPSRIAFTARGDLLARTGTRGSTELFDVPALMLIKRDHADGPPPIWSAPDPLAVQPGGGRLALGGTAGGIRIYDVRSGAVVARSPVDGDQITDVEFNRDGSVVGSVSAGGSLRLWDAATARPLGVFYAVSDPLWSVDFSPDGAYVLALGDDNRVRVLPCDVCGNERSLLSAATRRVSRRLTDAELGRYDEGSR